MSYKIKKLLLVSALSSASPAFANGDIRLEEVVVTAQKTSQMIQDVPISLTALSGAQLSESGIDNLFDLTTYVPNFEKIDTNNGAIVKIRGISSGVNPGFEQSVMLYMDDISLGRSPLARMAFMDLERVEVLRGPQNILLGKNSIAGALSMITAKPSNDPEAKIELSYEPEYEDATVAFSASGALSEVVRGRVAVRKAEYGGYYENTALNTDEESRDEEAVRLSLAWDVTDNLTGLLKVERDTIDTRGTSKEIGFSYTNPTTGLDYAQTLSGLGQISGQDIGETSVNIDRRNDSNIEDSLDLKVDLAQLTIDWDLDDYAVTFVTGYTGYDQKQICDCDNSAVDILSTHYDEQYDQFSQEIRVVQDSDDTLNWIVGAFYQTWDLDYRSFTSISNETNAFTAAGLGTLANLRTPRQATTESDTWSVFGQFTYHASDELRLTVGGRYTEEKKKGTRTVDAINASTGGFDLNQAIFTESIFALDINSLGETGLIDPATGAPYDTHSRSETRKESVFTPSLIVEYDISSDSMLYFSASKGFKAGGFDAQADREKNFEFEDESVESYEIGLKSVLMDGRMEINSAYFYTDYSDLQVSVYDGFAGFIVGNAGNAISQGVEIDGRYLLTEGLTLAGNVAYIDFEYKEWDGASCPSIKVQRGECDDNTTNTVDNAGTTAPRTPEFTAMLSLDYLLAVSNELDLRSTLDLHYSDEYFTDEGLDENIKQDAYTKVNLRMALEADVWTVALIANNITDEEINVFSTDVPLSGNLVGAPAYAVYLDKPRTLTLQAEYNFY